MKITLGLLSLIYSLSALSLDNAEIADDATSCAAVYYVLPQAEPENHQFQTATTQLAQLMADIAASNFNRAYGRTISRGEFFEKRDIWLETLRGQWPSQKSAVFQLYADCDGWRQGLAAYLSSPEVQSTLQSADTAQMEAIVLAAPVRPTDRGSASREQQEIISRAFNSWIANGGMTLEDFKKKLREVAEGD